MSKFLNNIKASFTGQEFPSKIVNGIITYKPDFHPMPDDLWGYREKKYLIGVNYYQSKICKEVHLDRFVNNFIAAMREEIYGDLKAKIHQLEYALFCEDETEILEIIDEIKKEING